MSPVDAAIEACRLRLRPILMTSIAFIAGVFPLVISRGAGAEMRQAMGVAVFSGMIGVTLFGLFLTPVFYVVLMKLGLRKSEPKPAPATPSGHGPALAGSGAAGVALLLIAGTLAAGAQSTDKPSRPANSRTVMISTSPTDLSSSRSLSPVTRNLEPEPTAAANTGRSFGSRKAGNSIEASSENKNVAAAIPSIRRAASSGERLNLETSFSQISAWMKGVITSRQRPPASFTICRQTPSRVSAASQTLVSRRTYTRQLKDFFLGHLRSRQRLVGQFPETSQPARLQPEINLLALFDGQGLQIFDHFDRAHTVNVASPGEERKPVFSIENV